MSENLKKILELASQDEAFAKELQSADKETLIRMAKERGITLTEEDFQKPDKELSEEELDSVAGGYECYCAVAGYGSYYTYLTAKRCACSFGGGGLYADNSTRCVCVMGGYGKDG